MTPIRSHCKKDIRQVEDEGQDMESLTRSPHNCQDHQKQRKSEGIVIDQRSLRRPGD